MDTMYAIEGLRLNVVDISESIVSGKVPQLVDE